MRIGLIVPGGVDRSGEERVIPALLALIRRLAAEHQVDVFATHQEPRPDVWMLNGARIHNLGHPRTARRAFGAILTEHRGRSFDILHAFWAGTTGALAVGASRLLHIPSLIHVSGGELVAMRDIAYGGCRSWRGRMLQQLVLRFANRVTAASKPICDLIAKRGVEPHRVPLGVDIQRWPLRYPTRRARGERARLVHVASLNTVKDQTTLLAALRLLADRGMDFQIDIVGEDTLDGRIQAMCERLGLARLTRFHGFLVQSRLRPLVEQAHVSVISSRHEAGPLVALEAAVAGVPTVGTAVGHLVEWNPSAALAVPPCNAAAIADAIEAVLRDEEFRLRLALEAQAHAAREDADHTARLFNALYAELLEAGRQRKRR